MDKMKAAYDEGMAEGHYQVDSMYKRLMAGQAAEYGRMNFDTSQTLDADAKHQVKLIDHNPGLGGK